MEKLLQYMESHSQALDHLTSKIDSFDHRLQQVEHSGALHHATSDTATETIMADEPAPKRKAELEDHRTAPHKLILLWPSVKPLLQNAKVEHGESYVMEAEDRGILRIYTRGEGIDEHDGTQPGGPASPARSDDSESAAPSPPEGLWGTGLPNTPNSDVRRTEPFCEGGLKPDGSLDLDMATINRLFDSYMRNMHRMHPFLDKNRLRKLVDRFINRYSTGHPTLRKFAVDSGSDQERPLKRQRSNGAAAVGIPGQDSAPGRREPTERSPGNAIIWLVLALGKICLHKNPLPGTVPDNKLNANMVISHQISGSNGVIGSSPTSANVRPSPISPRSTPITQPTPPSADGVQRPEAPSRRSSLDAFHGARNLDIIPGLAYYAKAAEILGDQGDGNDLVHAQMFLLAGLYKGQLARVKESMSWISMAGRAVMMLLDRYKLYNHNYWTSYGDTRKQYQTSQSRIRDKRHSLIVLASWTCLQLESDILAELRLPSSGIQTIENMLLMPHNMPEKEEDNYESLERGQLEGNDTTSYDNILMYYTAQTFLRKRLNQVHKEMYGDQCLNQPIEEVREMLSGHEETLSRWRDMLPLALRWNDGDPPPPDILDARLRAKYWGARYVINRPFLDYALHIMAQEKEGRSIEQAARDVHGNPREKAEIHLFKAISSMGEDAVWLSCKRCIDAAMHSTVAFDGVPDRLIVTNIHGTAHAYGDPQSLHIEIVC